MSSYPPPFPPPYVDPKLQRRMLKAQVRAQRDSFRAQREQFRMQQRGLRRGSILGPLMVIAVGVIFFLIQTGHLQDHTLWQWYSRWWPTLLLGAGVVLLGEWAFDQRTRAEGSAPTMRRGIGGGLFTLLLLLCVAGVIAEGVTDGRRNLWLHGFSINPDNIDEFFGDKHESDQQLAVSLAAGGGVSVDNPHGDVSISGTSDDNQIHVSARKQVFSRSDSDAAKKAERLNPQIATSNSGVAISIPAIDGTQTDLVITLPSSAAVIVTANHGDVHVGGIKAAVTLTDNHGDIDVSGVTGAVVAHINNSGSSFSAHSITGPVALEGHAHDVTLSDISGPVTMNGEFFGTTHVEHIRGQVKFHSSRTEFQVARLDGEIQLSTDADLTADQLLGPITLVTRNHNINLERISGDVSVTNSNGSVDVSSNEPLGNVTVQNRHGAVTLTVPDSARFTVQADTTDGELANDFSLNTQGTDTHKNLSGVVGNGGPGAPFVRISTTQGDVNLKHASLPPLAPLPPTSPRITAVPGDAREAVAEAQRKASDAAEEASRAAVEASHRARAAVSGGSVDGAEAERAAIAQAKEANRGAAEQLRQANEQIKEAQRELDRAMKKVGQHD